MVCSLLREHRLKLVGFQAEGPENALEFRIPDESFLEREKDWIPGPVMVKCAQSSECDSFAQGRIQVLRVSRGWWGSVKSISGKFEAMLSDGRSIAGSFSANYVKPSKRWICE